MDRHAGGEREAEGSVRAAAAEGGEVGAGEVREEVAGVPEAVVADADEANPEGGRRGPAPDATGA